MEKLSLKLPAMYADHHVTEVRRILLQLSGIQSVYASSAFQTVDISFDPSRTNESQIKAVLDEAGYLGELPLQVESSVAASRVSGDGKNFRHTTVYEQTSRWLVLPKM